MPILCIGVLHSDHHGDKRATRGNYLSLPSLGNKARCRISAWFWCLLPCFRIFGWESGIQFLSCYTIPTTTRLGHKSSSEIQVREAETGILEYGSTRQGRKYIHKYVGSRWLEEQIPLMIICFNCNGARLVPCNQAGSQPEIVWKPSRAGILSWSSYSPWRCILYIDGVRKGCWEDQASHRPNKVTIDYVIGPGIYISVLRPPHTAHQYMRMASNAGLDT